MKAARRKPIPSSSGWLELGPVAVELERNPDARSGGLEQLEAAISAASRQRQRAVRGARRRSPWRPNIPDQIALLLPLSGRAEAFGVAVRDGFIAAYLSKMPAKRPRLRFTTWPPNRWPAPTTEPFRTAPASWWAR